MYIYLDIVKQFCCKMCGTCCRRDWLITLDEASYNRNRQLFSEMEKTAEFAQVFQRITGAASPGEYAYIAKGARGGCWFLEKDNRCRLHRLVGHEHLDSVCQTFPRYPINSSRGIEFTLSFSCPEVLKIMERVEPLRIIRADETPTAFPADGFVEQVFPKQKRYSDPLQYYFEIEHHLIDILQCRALPLAQRMTILEQTVRQIEAMAEEDAPGQQLNRISARNYSLMDEAGDIPLDDQMTVEIMMEHFLVNAVFKKIFYVHGLQKGLRILNKFYQSVSLAAAMPNDGKDAIEAAKAAIMDLEFRFGHHRSSLGEL